MREVMSPRDEMTIDERRKYVKLMAERYQQAKRKERSQLLSEMEQVSKLHRKHLIRLLNGQSLDRKRRSEEHTSELQSHLNLVCRLLLEKKNGDRHRLHRRCPTRLSLQKPVRSERS